MKLRVLAFGLAAGVFLGLGVFVADAYSLLFGAGENIGIMQLFVIGFDRNWPGAFIGLVSGFVEGFVAASAFAWFYNRVLSALER